MQIKPNGRDTEIRFRYSDLEIQISRSAKLTTIFRKAAQYIRMSTEQQRYSTTNQKTFIAHYADAHGLEIVRTYIDEGKSGSYIVQAELPGAKKEDVIVTVDGDHFTIAAEIDQYDQKAEGEKIIQSERYFGSVRRTVRLPSMLDKSLSVAHFDNGILKLELAKERNKGSKNLEIK